MKHSAHLYIKRHANNRPVVRRACAALAAAAALVGCGTASDDPKSFEQSVGDPQVWSPMQLNGEARFKNAAGQTCATGATAGCVLSVGDPEGSLRRASAFLKSKVTSKKFSITSQFQLSKGFSADGITFVIQNAPEGLAALGGGGGGLGYGPDPFANGSGGNAKIAQSVAIKFDIYDNNGEGISSTGLYKNGATPSVPDSIPLPARVDLHSGHVFRVELAYDDRLKVLSQRVFDETVNPSALAFARNHSIDLPLLVGADTAFVGVTGGRGGASGETQLTILSFGAKALCPTNPAYTRSMLRLGSLVPAVQETVGFNDAGELVGTELFANETERRIVRYSSSAGRTEIQPMADGYDLRPTGINNVGTVVGTGSRTSGENSLAFYATPTTDAAWLFGGQTARTAASGINSSGEIAGFYCGTRPGDITATCWGYFSWAQANHFLRSPSNLSAFAYGLSDNGYIVGEGSITEEAEQHPILWYPTSKGKYATGVDLGTLGGAYGGAFRVNDAATVIGESYTEAEVMHAFVWTPDGGMKDLGSLGGASTAVGLNQQGEIVGSAELGAATVGVQYSDGKVIDLNGLIDPVELQGGRITSALAINNKSQVAVVVTNGDGSLSQYAVLSIKDPWACMAPVR